MTTREQTMSEHIGRRGFLGFFTGAVAALAVGFRPVPKYSVDDLTEATVHYIHMNGRFTISKRAIWATSADQGAFDKQLRYEGHRRMAELERLLGDQIYGLGQ